VGPWLEFVDRDEAHVYWTSRQPSPSILAYQLGETFHKVVDPMPKINHMLKISGLKRNRIYHYAVEVEYDGKRQRTSDHQCDTFFNYRPVTVTSNGRTSGKLAEAVLERVQISSGICALIGINNSGLAVALASQSDLRVIVFVDDKTQAEMLRREIEQTGAYGSRVSVLLTEPNDPLPLTPHCLNLVVAAINPASVGIAEKATHCLASTGRALWIENPARLSLDAIATAGLQDAEPLAGAGEWTHAYGRADNSAFGGESLAGARSQKDLVVQWIGRPGPRYQSDRSGRKSPPLAVAGRVFLQGLNRIIAVDSFNGTIHWSLEVPYFQRMNLPRDTSNWCADRHNIYAAVRDHCWKINVADGTVVDTWPVRDYIPGQGQVDWGYVSSAGEQLIGSVGHEGASWTDFWGGPGWYDEATGERAHKVCSRAIFGLHKLSGSPLWKYTRGVILNSTITVGDGRVCFVESREPTIVAKKQGRFGSTGLWQAQHLVALDAESGKLLWETPIDTVDGETAFCMAYSDNRFVIVSSANIEFHISTFDATTGQPTWTNRSAWGKGEADHGTHLSRPAIAGNRLYVRPAVFDLETGEKLPSEMPIGGCGTYACTDSALFFRGGPGVLSIWNSQDGNYTHWPRLRPDCWLSSIPADGLLLSPEGGGGCSCGKWLETSLAFIPRVHLQH
jgi:outer membrane protein assembly factor BamB